MTAAEAALQISNSVKGNSFKQQRYRKTIQISKNGFLKGTQQTYAIKLQYRTSQINTGENKKSEKFDFEAIECTFQLHFVSGVTKRNSVLYNSQLLSSKVGKEHLNE